MTVGNTRYWMAALVMVIGFIVMAPAAGAELREEYALGQNSKGVIDWEKGFIFVTAIGSANMSEMVNEVAAESVAMDTARYLAYRALNETVNKVRLNSKSLIEKSIMTDDALKIETEGVLSGAHVFDKRFSWTARGTPRAEVVIRYPLNGDLTYVAVEWAKKHKADETMLPRFSPPAVRTTPAAARTEPEKKHTGLIIDARGSGGRPAKMPRILSGDGQSIVLDWSYADHDLYLDIGLTGYTDTVEKARSNARVGANPLIVISQKIRGIQRCDFIVSDDDALRIITTDKQSSILKNCKTIIVLP